MTIFETINNLKPLNAEVMLSSNEHWDSLTKPLGSLGRLESLVTQICGITGLVFPRVDKKCTIIMCADNGVTDEGISSCPKEVTATVTKNFTKGVTGINVLSKFAKADICIVDIGVEGEISFPEILNRKIMNGTNNIAIGPAMTREQAISAIETGIEIAESLIAKGYNLLNTGEMGIGNTTTSSAVLTVLTGRSVEETTGKGSGLSKVAYENKKEVIKRAIKINNPNADDVIDVIAKVGGLDIAGLCGAFIGSANKRTPIIIDGLISGVAAICACRLNPMVKEYLIPSHSSAEPGARAVNSELNFDSYINADMRLGEGTGGAIMFNLIEAAFATYTQLGKFVEVDIKPYVPQE